MYITPPIHKGHIQFLFCLICWTLKTHKSFIEAKKSMKIMITITKFILCKKVSGYLPMISLQIFLFAIKDPLNRKIQKHKTF